MPMHYEAPMTIAGHRLTEAQAMTVRVACTSFKMQLDDPVFARHLGPTAEPYRQRLEEVMKLILEGEL